MKTQRVKPLRESSTAGMWRSPDRRFFFFKSRYGWEIHTHIGEEIAFLRAYGLRDRMLPTRFPTRREAAARLRDAYLLAGRETGE